MRRITESGFKAYLVGGCVRDMAMGLVPQDWDMTGSARPGQVMELFPRAVPTGIQHGTVTIVTDAGIVEYTTFRREGAYSDGRRPDAVEFADRVEDDLIRRDFTMNALALGIDGVLVDICGGLVDINNKIIRCVGEPERRFAEDSLRILRALRFAAKTEFEIEPRAREAMRRLAELTKNLARERVRREVEGILMSPRPELVNELFALGILEGAEADYSRLDILPNEALDRWAGLTALSGQDAHGFLTGLRLEANIIRSVTAAEKLVISEDTVNIKRCLSANDASVVSAACAMAAVSGDRGAYDRVRAVRESGECFELASLAVTGAELRALGLSGAETGKTLRRLLDHVIENPEDNTREKLLKLI